MWITASVRVHHLSLEVEQSERFELNRGFGAQISSQRPWKILQLLNTVSDTSFQPAETQSIRSPGTAQHSSTSELHMRQHKRADLCLKNLSVG